jgi:hypothetical protein
MEIDTAQSPNALLETIKRKTDPLDTPFRPGKRDVVPEPGINRHTLSCVDRSRVESMKV